AGANALLRPLHRAVSLAALCRRRTADHRAAACSASRSAAMNAMSDVTFDYPYLLALAGVLPLLAILVVWHAYRQRKARLDLPGNMEVVSRLIPPNTLKGPGWRMLRLGLASALVGIAVAGPRWGDERSVVRSRGIDMCLALDASLSMTARDER